MWGMTKTSSRKATAPPPRQLIFFFLIFLSFLTSSTATSAAVVADTIAVARPLRDGETITSAAGVFELGFFGFNNSAGQNRYVGIWYKKIPSSPVVWVANRDNPIPGPTGVLKINQTGSLSLLDGSDNLIWFSSNQHGTKPTNNNNTSPIVAKLLDCGNFVLRREGEDDENDAGLAWQSFDYPTDTLLPGMKLGRDMRTGLDRFLRSWKNPADPSSGDYTFRMDPWGLPEVFLWNGAVRVYRSGPWNGFGFSGVPEMRPGETLNFTFTANADEVFYSDNVLDKSIISRLVANSSGLLQRYTWIADRRQWAVIWYAPSDQCDIYGQCGPYGVCDPNTFPVCTCPEGFRPANPQQWQVLRDASDGCARRSELGCGDGGYGFLLLKGVKMPETSTAFVDRKMSLPECEGLCRRNCSCVAYANSERGSGCVMWTGDLMDVRHYADGVQDLYLRVAASDLENSRKTAKGIHGAKKIFVIVAVSVLLAALLSTLLCYRLSKLRDQAKRRKDHKLSFLDMANSTHKNSEEENECEEGHKKINLPFFNMREMKSATVDFSNKLGQGGFGIVYKGRLSNGQEIAVKRLSKHSSQGAEEFKNEVLLIARLQHRNLVKLLGCCIDDKETMLIYEYMPNKSLDSFIFDDSKKALLDWKRRYEIIIGIARGILYLHQDSRLRIVHRDLKTSNILLDAEMIPKISDFGMARIFEGNQSQEHTNRVVGTFGYMSPEYALDGLFSARSDVFSFGVILLEIISGNRNHSLYNNNPVSNLIRCIWDLWTEGRALEIVDPSMGDSWQEVEVLRCVQVGLLCVQENAIDRPTMFTVISMLSNEISLPSPKQPPFALRTRVDNASSSTPSRVTSCSNNDVTMSILEPR